MIFKLQRSLSPSRGQLLIYNEDRSICLETPLRADIDKAFRGRMKVYFEGHIDPLTDEMVIHHEVEEQPW